MVALPRHHRVGMVLTKIISYLGFDASQKLVELEISIIPELKKTAHAIDAERMLRRGAKKVDSDAVATLDKMAGILWHARYEAEDILDLMEYRRIGNTCMALRPPLFLVASGLHASFRADQLRYFSGQRIALVM